MDYLNRSEITVFIILENLCYAKRGEWQGVYLS